MICKYSWLTSDGRCVVQVMLADLEPSAVRVARELRHRGVMTGSVVTQVGTFSKETIHS